MTASPPGWVVDEARAFVASRDLAAALRESSSLDWGALKVGDPVVVAALRVAELCETLHHKYDAPYRCNSCRNAGTEQPAFAWAGALFVHLLTCPHFRAMVNPPTKDYDSEEPDPRDDRRYDDPDFDPRAE